MSFFVLHDKTTLKRFISWKNFWRAFPFTKHKKSFDAAEWVCLTNEFSLFTFEFLQDVPLKILKNEALDLKLNMQKIKAKTRHHYRKISRVKKTQRNNWKKMKKLEWEQDQKDRKTFITKCNLDGGAETFNQGGGHSFRCFVKNLFARSITCNNCQKLATMCQKFKFSNVTTPSYVLVTKYHMELY